MKNPRHTGLDCFDYVDGENWEVSPNYTNYTLTVPNDFYGYSIRRSFLVTVYSPVNIRQ